MYSFGFVITGTMLGCAGMGMVKAGMEDYRGDDGNGDEDGDGDGDGDGDWDGKCMADWV